LAVNKKKLHDEMRVSEDLRRELKTLKGENMDTKSKPVIRKSIRAFPYNLR
jgi:hypothetical protein